MALPSGPKRGHQSIAFAKSAHAARNNSRIDTTSLVYSNRRRHARRDRCGRGFAISAARRARGHRAPTLERVVVRRDRRIDWQVNKHGPSLVRVRFILFATELVSPMSHPEDERLNRNDEASSGLSHELQSFEARLARLSPRDDRLDRERLAFLAGQASMSAEVSRPSPPVQDWRRHPAWPAAFAGMSALAATLLVILFTRPALTDASSPNPRNFAASDQLKTTPQATSIEPLDHAAGILSPGAAQHDDIETMLSRPVEITAAWPHAIEPQNRPALTPTAWREFSESPAANVAPADSSSLPTHRRIHS